MNPYANTHFFEFFLVLLKRLLLFLTGNIPLDSLESDEIQMIVMATSALTSSLIGPFLILRKMTMLANAISHTILLGIVIAYVFLFELFSSSIDGGFINIETLMIASLIMALITAFLTEFFTKQLKLQEDASVGLVFTALFAIGVSLVTLLTKDQHIGTEAVMGNVDALQLDDSYFVIAIFLFNLLLTVLFFKEYAITTFDPLFATSQGISSLFFNYLLMIQFAACAVVSFRAVGVIMVLALITGPPLTARLLTHDLKKLIGLSMAIGALSAIFGVALSRHILTVTGAPLSTGGVTICLISFVYAMTLLFIFLRDGRSGRGVEKGFVPR